MIKIVCDRCKMDVSDNASNKQDFGIVAWSPYASVRNGKLHGNGTIGLYLCRDCANRFMAFLFNKDNKNYPALKMPEFPDFDDWDDDDDDWDDDPDDDYQLLGNK